MRSSRIKVLNKTRVLDVDFQRQIDQNTIYMSEITFKRRYYRTQGTTSFLVKLKVEVFGKENQISFGKMSAGDGIVIRYPISLLDPNLLTLATGAIPTNNLPSRSHNIPDQKTR